MPYKEFAATTVGRSPRGKGVGRPYGPLIWIVWHTTEGSETLNAAENGNEYDARRTDGTSCHVFCDGNSVVQEVNSGDRAWAALAVANNRGYQVELCGRAAQTANQWRDTSSAAMLILAAQHVARVCLKYDIPPRWLTRNEVLARKPGMITHKNVTDWIAGTHVDPGPNFPYATMAGQVAHWVHWFGTSGTNKPAPIPVKVDENMRLVKLSGAPAVWKTDGFKREYVKGDPGELADLIAIWGTVKTVKNLDWYGKYVPPLEPKIAGFGGFADGTPDDGTDDSDGTPERDHSLGPQ